MPKPIEIDSKTNADAAAGQGRAQRGPLGRTLDATHSSVGDNPAARSINFAQVNRVSLAIVLAHYGILKQLKPLGSQLSGCCPIHDGSNPKQFVVHLASNNWHCFGDCNRGGGALEFVAQRERVPIARAAQVVAEWFALSPRPTRPQPQRRKSMNTRPSHRAYVVEDADGDQPEQKGFWTRIGSAWPHKDGKGLNIVLAALPVGGRIVLREYTAEDEAADAKRANRSK
jgi:CHC2-type zinc finger protein